MFTFLYNAVRIFAYSLVVLTAVAAGVGRMNPPPPIRRTSRPALRVEHVGSPTPCAWNLGYRLRDPATGRLEPFAAPGGDRLNHASGSPWRDSEDRSQLVAQWVSYEGRGKFALPIGSGIARYSIPDGAVLDRVHLESPPTSPPCWYPGTEARILYTAGDGWLYHYNFDARGDDAGGDGGKQPRPLTWTDRPPGLEGIVFFNPIWPDDPRLRGRLIVALSRLVGSGKNLHYTPMKLWWLQLDPGGTRVDAAGRLTVPGADEEEFEERYPLVTTSPGGELVLSYTEGPRGKSEARPRHAPIAIDPVTHAPIVLLTASDAPAEGAPPIAPRPSVDGRQLTHSRGGHLR